MSEIRTDKFRQSEATRRRNGEDCGNENPCFLCGRETTGALFALIDETGGYFITRDEINEACWFEPIGPECAKKLPAAFVGEML